MKITYREFFESVLLGAKLLDAHTSNMHVERYTWRQFAFNDDGVHYIQPEDRGKPNPAFKPEELMK